MSKDNFSFIDETLRQFHIHSTRATGKKYTATHQSAKQALIQGFKAAMLEVIDKYSEAEEVVENGKRYLVVDGEKLPYGYPYPDSKAKYVVVKVVEALETLVNSKGKS